MDLVLLELRLSPIAQANEEFPGLALERLTFGALLGKTSPNALVGVRTPWTFSSPLAWEKANRLAGRLFFWGGVAGGLAMPFAPQPAGFKAVTLGALAVAAVAVFESWRVWRGDPDRIR